MHAAMLLSLASALVGGPAKAESAVAEVLSVSSFKAANSSGFSLLPPLPPEPIALPRRNLGPAFAVLLLRSGYDTADNLDFIAMDQFQRDFWLLRHSEWEPYTIQYSPIKIKQGELSDPKYFDFIAAIQFTTITKAMVNGQQTFKEFCGEECPPGVEGDYRLITRDPALQDNKILPIRFERNLGAMLLKDLREGFRGVQFNAPPRLPSKCSTSDLIAGIESILKVFVDQGYCINAQLSDVATDATTAETSFKIKVDGPANLWALQSVASRGGKLYPVYDAFVIREYIEESNSSKRRATCKFSWTDQAVTEEWRISNNNAL